jgi:hypothetical protein
VSRQAPEPLPPVERAKLRLECLKLAMATRREGEAAEQIQARADAHLAWVMG